MCISKLFGGGAPSLPPPVVAPEPVKQPTPTFGASNANLNKDKNQRAKRRGSSGFKIDLQTAGSKAGLNVGGS